MGDAAWQEVLVKSCSEGFRGKADWQNCSQSCAAGLHCTASCSARLFSRVAKLGCKVGLQGWAAKQGCKAGPPGRAARQGCKAGLQGRVAKRGCKAGLQSRVARQGCQAGLKAGLQGRAARQDGAASLFGSVVRQACRAGFPNLILAMLWGLATSLLSKSYFYGQIEPPKRGVYSFGGVSRLNITHPRRCAVTAPRGS